MEERTRGSTSLVRSLLTIRVTLGVWVYIFSRAPQATFHDQGGLLITIILFPLTFLGLLIGGVGAITAGLRALRDQASNSQWAAFTRIALGALGLLMSLGTCVIPEMLAEVIFGGQAAQ
jgi:hypothetical protein